MVRNREKVSKKWGRKVRGECFAPPLPLLLVFSHPLGVVFTSHAFKNERLLRKLSVKCLDQHTVGKKIFPVEKRWLLERSGCSQATFIVEQVIQCDNHNLL